MFYEKLRAIYAKLTYSETKIADYILANRENVFNMTSQQMADNLGVGQSTVIRFSQKLGYKNYVELAYMLQCGPMRARTVWRRSNLPTPFRRPMRR